MVRRESVERAKTRFDVQAGCSARRGSGGVQCTSVGPYRRVCAAGCTRADFRRENRRRRLAAQASTAVGAGFYEREEREAELEVARREKSSCETSFFEQLMESSMPEPEVRPDRREAHQAAEARLREIRDEPVAPLIPLTRLLEKLLPTLSNLDRYENTLFRSLMRALHELQRLQAMRAAEPVPSTSRGGCRRQYERGWSGRFKMILQNKPNRRSPRSAARQSMTG